jgi:hypothetical protein
MRRMLTIPNEIWTPCEFTRQVFRDAGIPNVHRIPAPIAVPSVALPIRFPDIPPDLDNIPWINLRVGFGRYGDINRSIPSHPHRLSEIIVDFYAGNQPLVFVSMLNPREPGKNLTALIGGFLEFHNEHPDSLLLLKLVVDNTGDRLDSVLTGILRLHISGCELIDSNAVWLATAGSRSRCWPISAVFLPPICAPHWLKVKIRLCRKRWRTAWSPSQPGTRRCSTASAKTMR